MNPNPLLESIVEEIRSIASALLRYAREFAKSCVPEVGPNERSETPGDTQFRRGWDTCRKTILSSIDAHYD